jgi:hypothetical protein
MFKLEEHLDHHLLLTVNKNVTVPAGKGASADRTVVLVATVQNA